MTTPEPPDEARGPCWFCKGTFPVDALIAGYDTFDEQRLACLACNERMSGNWRPSLPAPVAGADPGGFVMFVGSGPAPVPGVDEALPDPTNDETLTMTGYQWWRYRRLIEAAILHDARERGLAHAASCVWHRSTIGECSCGLLRYLAALSTPVPLPGREYCVICGDDGHHGDEHHDVVRYATPVPLPDIDHDLREVERIEPVPLPGEEPGS